MILKAEHGLHFASERGRWRCVEHLGLVMLRADRHRVGWREFVTLQSAWGSDREENLQRHQSSRACSAALGERQPGTGGFIDRVACRTAVTV